MTNSPIQGIPFSSPEELKPDQFIEKAKRIVVIHENMKNFDQSLPLTDSDIYVVWFAKTLQNWKALLSTNRPNGLYFELTYNGDAQETYLDTYVKAENNTYRDEDIH